ncbi:MAG TPA: hypothetical protein VG944_15915 [Fimbriimonas sp.]|nr:hypothetical protein [Fimbriimonas sp.]
MSIANSDEVAASLAQGVQEYIDRSVERSGSTVAIKPGHRVKFHWPPHPISYSYHVLASDWTGRTVLDAHGEQFEVEVATTPNGVFGRSPELWHEDRGDTEEAMLANLRKSLEPLLQRQKLIGRTLEQEGRFTGHIHDLEPLGLLKLLFCEDRDVANEARTEIETRASSGIFMAPLLTILNDRRHPYRRSAQWSVLDLFEDLPSFSRSQEDSHAAIVAIRNLIWSAEDDYARTIYKAGVVLGGHIPYMDGAEALVECFEAPSKIGRRSAIHGSFHTVEWMPETKDRVLAGLAKVTETDPEPLLREYAAQMARDIRSNRFAHTPDVMFPDEA